MVNDQDKNLTKTDLKLRTKEFALRCMKLCAALPADWAGNHLKYQLFKSATSVAANYRSACAAQSRKSFLSKLGIVVEEADETLYWFEIIIEENMLPQQKVEPLMQEADELTAIFITARKTARKNCPSSIVHRQ